MRFGAADDILNEGGLGMYGTIFRMKVKPGQESKVVDSFKEWDASHQPIVDGAMGSLLMRPDNFGGEMIGVAVFRDKASYDANADNPRQDEWFRGLRELLEDDPVWEDGEYVAGGIS